MSKSRRERDGKMNLLKVYRENKMRLSSTVMRLSLVMSVLRFRTELVRCYLTGIRV